MNNNLTFNLDKINNENMKGIKTENVLKMHENQMYIRAYQYKEIFMHSFKTTSTEIRDFIEKTFGIFFSPDKTNHYSHHRNQLNKIIKNNKLTQTKRGQKMILDFEEYTRLITSDDFIKFINSNLQKDNIVTNQKKMYEELMYLQVNKYQTMNRHKEKNLIKNNALAFALNISTNLVEEIKALYCIHLKYPNNEFYKFDINEETLNLLEITKYRFIQSNLLTYKYHSEHDVLTTNHEQIIRHFLEDVDRWNNNITDGSLT